MWRMAPKEAFRAIRMILREPSSEPDDEQETGASQKAGL